MESVRRYVLLGIVIFLAINVVYLDWRILLSPAPTVQNINIGGTSQQPSNTQSQTTKEFIPQTSCPMACLGVINQATSSIKLETNQTVTQSNSSAQEYFIPLGSGSSSSTSWTSLGGVAATIDISQYPNVQTVYLEVTGYIPTGNEQIWIQLYNATDGYVIPGSQVTMSGGTAQLLTSSNLTLPSGSKLYQVQMQTQLTYPAIVEQARLHITTQ